ncbi:calcium-binding protein [Desulfofustis glycolicus]|uniref:Ca2+-binding protein, RTX toxin-related n=1 Tax=Desulfofustis glycolicus DSM 9705 TaxID=1121409 RepID=A0A1M5YPC7_9BACT|nr:calcium-binding protein [Desulfofustis glycolicus]SHI13729.1 Ca2+-binding protein, RTX toxin-related [Desulfofustis glycolicus DSM 9705]
MANCSNGSGHLYAGNNSLQGADGNDQLFGGAGNDNLSGGAGSDLLYGGLGDDTYSISDLEDTIVEYEGEGFDTIDSQVSYTLGDHVERLRLLGTAATAIGNELDNELIGNSADNLLDGGTGADTMLGGAGNDTYITESAGDQIIEGTGAGIDTEQRGYETTSQLAGGVENLMLGTSVINGSGNELDNTITGNEQDNILHGWAGQDILIGGAGNDQLEGGAGHDELIGGSGADSMWGGTGDDIYIVDDAGDQVIEFADEGFDTIRSSLDIVLPDNVEMAFLTGDGDTNITANDLDNSLSGNSGNNIIDGGAGADYMAGMDGDDVYITDNEYDLIAEEEDQGTDTEMRGYETSYSLRDNVENLTLTGTVYRGNGNELDNVITGNDAENNLWGREGSDTLYGNGGDDSLFGDLGDDHLEGNGGDDYLDGGEGDDILLGGEGNDQLDGGAGFNELRGGSGDDVYVYRADAGDYVIDNSDGGQDWLIFTDDITADRLTFVRSGDDLVVQVNRGESTNSVTVTNWFAGENYQLYGIQPAGASGLLAATINQMFPPDNPEPDGIVVPDESEFDAALHGTLGNDQYPDHVGGTSGNDILRGYQGNDMLYGGAGNDVYIFEAGSGADVIDASGGGMDFLYFDEGLTLDSLGFSRSSDNLVITVEGTDDSVTVLDWFVDADHQLEFIQPFGGSMLSAAQVSNLVADDPPPVGDFDTVVEGTASGEQLVGTSGADQLNAYEGDDQLFGLAGNDELNGGDGADYLDGGEGHDVLNGGAGNDQLSGGTGEDVLAGGAGDDTYIYGSGSGADLIDNSGGGTDWLLFTDGITSERLSFIQSGDDLVIRVDGDESSQVTVTGWFLGAQYQLAYVQPDGEYGISAATINELFTGSGDEPNPDDFDFVRTGTAAAEQLVGTNGMDLIDGLGGDDQLFGLGGNDWLKGGDGADYLGGGASNDSLFGEAGDDVIFAENGDDYLEGGIGGDYLDGGAGNDMIVGGDGNDQLRGQGGNDTLIGGDGNDNYVYQTGGGADLIINNGGGLDILFFQDGITLERLSFHQSGDDMVVRVDNDDATSVTIQDWYLDADNQVEFLQPDGGYLISAAQITALAQPDLMMAGPTGLMALSAGMMNGDDYTNFRTSAGTSLFGTDSAAQSVSHGLEDLTTKKDSVVGDLMIAA